MDKMLTIDGGEIGKKYIFIDCTLEGKVKTRLESLGLTQDAAISVVNKKKSGAMIVKIRGTRFAIGKYIAKSLTVMEEK